MEHVTLESRRAGSLRPDTILPITVDGVAMANLASYTWLLEAHGTLPNTTALLFSKTTGITSDSTQVTIAWLDADLGALTANANDYYLELTGTYQTKSFKQMLKIKITPTLVAV